MKPNNSFFVVIVILYGILLITNSLVSLRRLSRNSPSTTLSTSLFRNVRNSAGFLAIAYMVAGICLSCGGLIYLALR